VQKLLTEWRSYLEEVDTPDLADPTRPGKLYEDPIGVGEAVDWRRIAEDYFLKRNKGPPDAAKMNKNLREAALLRDLQYWEVAGEPKKWIQQPALSESEIHNLKEAYFKVVKAWMDKRKLKEPTPKELNYAWNSVGRIGGGGFGMGNLLKKNSKLPGWHRWSSVRRGRRLSNVWSGLGTGLSSQKMQLFDLLAKSGWWKQLRMDDPIRKDFKTWIQTRLERSKKGSKANKAWVAARKAKSKTNHKK
jgi:hypothetical protein